MLKKSVIASLSLSAVLAVNAYAQAPRPQRPDLVILIAVDQMREEYLERFAPQFTGGFARMLHDGAFFTNAFQDHAVTETAVGHSAMLSGRFPRSVGIVANIAGIQDPQAPLVGGGPGASPFRFRGSTLTDWLRVNDPASRALSISAKDRAAILMQGRPKQNVFWYYNGAFTTSRYYADTLPTWLRAFNAQKIPQSYAGKAWTLLLDPSKYPEADSVTIEARGRNFMFPHVLPADPAQAANGLTSYPFMDEVLLRLALTGIDSLKLGHNGHPDILSVSLSPTDYIGHAYGPESREIHDQIVRLDRTLGAFLDSLDARFQPGQVVIALTGDHGVTAYPQLHYKEEPGVDMAPAQKAARDYAARKGVADSSAVNFDSGMLILNPLLFGYRQSLMDSVATVFARAARKVPGVARVQFVKDLAHGDTIHDAITRRWNHMIPRDLPIPVVVTTVPTRVWGNATVAEHGSPYDIDAHVPIVFLGSQFKHGRYNAFARTVDIAPTFAWLLGINPTETIDGRPLRQAIK